MELDFGENEYSEDVRYISIGVKTNLFQLLFSKTFSIIIDNNEEDTIETLIKGSPKCKLVAMNARGGAECRQERRR